LSACCASRTSGWLAIDLAGLLAFPEVRVLEAVLVVVSVDGIALLRLVSFDAYVLPDVPAVELPVPIVERVVPAGVVPMLPAGVPVVLALMLLPVLLGLVLP
jgi:hypothetical protein